MFVLECIYVNLEISNIRNLSSGRSYSYTNARDFKHVRDEFWVSCNHSNLSPVTESANLMSCFTTTTTTSAQIRVSFYVQFMSVGQKQLQKHFGGSHWFTSHHNSKKFRKSRGVTTNPPSTQNEEEFYSEFAPSAGVRTCIDPSPRLDWIRTSNLRVCWGTPLNVFPFTPPLRPLSGG